VIPVTCTVRVVVQVVKLKGLSSVIGWSHYFAIISRFVVSDDEKMVDSVVLGIDIKHDVDSAVDDGGGGHGDGIVDDDDDDDDDDEDDGVNIGNVATVGLVLPITSNQSVTITGQGYVSVRFTPLSLSYSLTRSL